MTPRFALLFVLGFAGEGLCLQSSCGAERGPADPQGAAGCGCGIPRRGAAAAAAAAAGDPAEDRAASVDPAPKYSRAASESSGGRGDDEEMPSRVGWGSSSRRVNTSDSWGLFSPVLDRREATTGPLLHF